MQGHITLGVHFALVIKAERLLCLGQDSPLLLILVKRQPATAQRLQRQFPGFLCRVRAQFR